MIFCNGSQSAIRRFTQAAILMGVLGLLLVLPSLALAQTGTVTGKVFDEKSGEALIGASVLIEGTTIGASCDIDGNYTIRNVPVGTVNLVVSSVGYQKKRITGVVVGADKPATLEVSLNASDIQLETIEVTAERQRASESSMLVKRRQAPNVTDGISSEMFAKSGASDAGDAVKQVVGVSVVDDKNVVVRGLSGRYANVRLNGAVIPSPEPEKREVPLDLFPTGLLEEVVTSKTFTPDQSANFSGGSVNLETKDFPAALIMDFSSSVGYNSASTGKERRNYQGGGLDWLGIDDGTRALPSALANPNWFNSSQPRLTDSAANAAATRSFSNQWTPTLARTPVNTNYALNLGNTFDFGNSKRLGMSASLTYSNTYKVEQGAIYREWNNDSIPWQDYYNIDQGKQSVLWGALFNTSLNTSENNKFSFKGMYNRSADDRAFSALAYDDYNGQDILETRLEFVSRWVASGQVSGEHHLPWLANSTVQWHTDIAGAGRDEPDNRSVLYSLTEMPDGTVLQTYNNSSYSLSRIYTNLEDRNTSAALDWIVPLGGDGNKFKFGGTFGNGNRVFAGHRYQYRENRNPVDTGYAESMLAPENLGSSSRLERNVWYLEDATYAEDHYNANDHMRATYLMLDVGLVGRLRFVGGSRYEDYRLNVISGSRINGDTLYPKNTADWLPMASLIYGLTDQMKLRGVISRTMARPEYRELVPYAHQDYGLGYATRGNPDLKSTYITNYDLRWEYFPKPGEILAVSFFAKSFQDPIEILVIPGATRPILQYSNINKATNYGMELEARKSLSFLSSRLTRFSFGTNVTLTKSKMTLDGRDYSRPLSGQSPFIINSLVSYTSQSGATSATLLYNAFGDRLVRLTTIDQKGLYEQTRHQVDFTLNHKLWQTMTFKFGVKNLLNEDYLVTQEQPQFGIEGTTEFHRIGRTVSMGVSYGL